MRSPWLVFVALFGAAGAAHAEPAPREALFSASIDYVVPRDCPSREDFEAIVVGRLGFDPFVADAPHHVLVSIEEGERTLEGRLEWRDEAGRWAGDRAFPVRTTNCAELARAMGFALAVQINLLAAGTEPAPSRPASAPPVPQGPAVTAKPAVAAKPAGATKPGVAEGSDDATPSDAAAASGVPWSFAFGAGAAVGIGMAPNPIALGRLFAGAGSGRWSVELGGELSTQALARRADGAGYRQQIFLASAAACGTEAPFTLCLLAKGGAVNVEGRSVDVPASPSGKVLQAGLRFGARQGLGDHTFVGAGVEALLNLTRWNVTLDQLSVWKAPTFAGTLGVEIGADF